MEYLLIFVWFEFNGGALMTVPAADLATCTAMAEKYHREATADGKRSVSDCRRVAQ